MVCGDHLRAKLRDLSALFAAPENCIHVFLSPKKVLPGKSFADDHSNSLRLIMNGPQIEGEICLVTHARMIDQARTAVSPVQIFMHSRFFPLSQVK
jgi:hypothetical protein